MINTYLSQFIKIQIFQRFIIQLSTDGFNRIRFVCIKAFGSKSFTAACHLYLTRSKHLFNQTFTVKSFCGDRLPYEPTADG